MSKLAVKMQQDLEKKLDRIRFMHDQLALYVAEEFFELRSRIDIETEELLARLQKGLVHFLKSKPAAELPKFVCMGKLKKTYTGYSAESSTIQTEFVSYRFPNDHKAFKFEQIYGMSPGLDLLDFTFAKECVIKVSNSRLESLDFLVASSAQRLESLFMDYVHLGSFDADFLARCVNLRNLQLKCVLSEAAAFNVEFLRSMKKLTSLQLSLRDLIVDMSVFKELPLLSDLTLSGALSPSGTSSYPKLDVQTVIRQLTVLPSLVALILESFQIDRIGARAFAGFKQLKRLTLKANKIGSIDPHALASDSDFLTCMYGNEVVIPFKCSKRRVVISI